MSDQLFEVAFSGQISDGANPDEVKGKVGKMFNADEGKLAQLFSGKRIVIKKNVDLATANKYQTALNRAGAECEVVQTGGDAAVPTAEPSAVTDTPVAAAAAPAAPAEAAAAQEYESSYDGEVAPPPQLDPLGITGDQIDDLAATVAPVGSELQDDYQAPAEPEIDIAGFDIARWAVN